MDILPKAKKKSISFCIILSMKLQRKYQSARTHALDFLSFVKESEVDSFRVSGEAKYI